MGNILTDSPELETAQKAKEANESKTDVAHSPELEAAQKAEKNNEVTTEASEEDFACAICFEQIAQSTELPCACKISYCARCWDRCLAQSVNSCGEARCPTCRSPIAVDFDADKACLVFSRAPARHGSPNIRIRRQIENKLREQALPGMVRLLQNYGRQYPAFGDIARAPEAQLHSLSMSDLEGHATTLDVCTDGPLEKEELIRRLVKEASEKEMMGHLLGARFAASVEKAPSCVCGCSLIRISGSERGMRYLDTLPLLSGVSRDSEQYQRIFQSASENSLCFCDLCGGWQSVTNYVWTCENGDTTILHANSWDICDECFTKHVAFDSKSNTCTTADVDVAFTNEPIS